MKILALDPDDLQKIPDFQARLEAMGHVLFWDVEEASQQSIDMILLPEPKQGTPGALLLNRTQRLSTPTSPLLVLYAKALSATEVSKYLKMGFDGCLSMSDDAVCWQNQLMQLSKFHSLLQDNKGQRKGEQESAEKSLSTYTRQECFKLIEQTIDRAKQDGSKFALLHIDIDDFRNINESLGTLAGDQALSLVHARIDYNIRQEDILLPLGGDEFFILTGMLDKTEDANIIAKTLLQATENHYNVDGNLLGINFSIGVAAYPGTDSAQELAQDAYSAMQEAKNRGKNCHHFFSESLRKTALRKNIIKRELLFALPNKEFSLVYQPIFNLDTKTPSGLEALIRWESKVLGSVTPSEFIPILESNHMIGLIGNWVCQEVFKMLSRAKKARVELPPVSINLSPYQLSEKFLDDLMTGIQEAEIPLQRIVFELTETAIMLRENPVAWQALQKLHALGFKIHVDDFGTGYSSLSHLRHLPFSGIKIDRSFTKDFHDKKSIAIIQSTIALAKSLELDVIAEGIETKEHLDFLQKKGCCFGQGYFLAKPMKEADLFKAIRKTQEGDHKK